MAVSCYLFVPVRKALPSLVLTVVFFLAGSGKLFASDDWGYWNTVVLEHSFNDKWEASLEGEVQFVDDFQEFMNHNYTATLLYGLNANMQLGMNFKYEMEKEEGEWVEENRPGALSVTKWKWNDIKCKLISLLEYRMLEDEDNTWRLREYIKFSKPVEINSFAFTPFVSAELFYDFESDELNQNRLYIGASKDLTESTELSLYYMRKNKKDDADDWPGENVLGTEFVVKF